MYDLGFVDPSDALVRVKSDYIYRVPIDRDFHPDLTDFVGKVDKSGQSLSELMRTEVSPNLSAFGTVFAIIDKPTAATDNKAQELALAMPYVTLIENTDVYDFEWAPDGKLLWFRYRVCLPVDRSDPFNPKKLYETADSYGIATWTKDAYFLHDLKGKLLVSTPHTFGFVPVVIQAQNLRPGHTLGRSSFFRTTGYIAQANNLFSICNNELATYGSVLMVHEDDSPTDTTNMRDPETGMLRMTQRTHDIKKILKVANMQNPPAYLMKDINLITESWSKGQEYMAMAIENERCSKQTETEEPRYMAQSGIAKAYDFAELDAALSSHALVLEAFEEQVLSMVSRMLGVDPELVDVDYPDTFDVRSLDQRLQSFITLKTAGLGSATLLSIAAKQAAAEFTDDDEEMGIIESEIDATFANAEEEGEDPAAESNDEKEEKDVSGDDDEEAVSTKADQV